VILAMGGGGFTMEPANPLLDDFVLDLAPSREPRILFLPTASGDETAQINAFLARFGDRSCAPEHLSLFRLRDARRPLEQVVLEQDIIYVGGGSMRNLLAIWRAHGLDRLLIAALQSGTVMAGLSAGAMCWFQGGVSCSSGPPAPIAGLGLLEGSLTVHACVRDETLPGGWALDDGVALLFRGGCLERVVSSRPGAGALRVDAIAGELIRRRVEPELLGEEQRHTRKGLDDDVQELRRVQRMRRGAGRGLAGGRGGGGERE
jgi:dipeptidase E